MIQVDPMRHKHAFDGKNYRSRFFTAGCELGFNLGDTGSHDVTTWNLRMKPIWKRTV